MEVQKLGDHTTAQPIARPNAMLAEKYLCNFDTYIVQYNYC